MTGDPQVRRHPDEESLVAAVADALVDRLRTLQASGRVPRLVLTGGGVADRLHRNLAASAVDAVDWSRVELWWGDERYVESWSDDRNARQARQALLDHVAVDEALVHEPPASDSGRPVDQAAAAWAEGFPEGDFDVTVLGVGPDGHTASLFPGLPQVHETATDAVPVTESPKPPPLRLSMTVPRLSRSTVVWFVVSGDAKAEAVSRALADDADPAVVPASGPRGREATVWWLDEAAAALLPR